MYDYRRMTEAQRKTIVQARIQHGLPWHRPPHPDAPGEYRIVTAACYEHKHILAREQRLQWFETRLLDTLKACAGHCAAWCVLPNHYHVLVQIGDMKAFGRAIGQLHGGTSFEMNQEDNKRGRQVWYRCSDRVIRSERHFYATLNYIHHNPVKHGYVDKWQDWPFSSVHWYLETQGRDWLKEIWAEFPLLSYGDKWDVM